MLPLAQVDQLHLHRPLCCPHCQTDLSPDLPQIAAPVRRQITEVPPLKPYVAEHQLLNVACPNCARPLRASLPDNVPPGAFGPNLVALVALLHGRFRQLEVTRSIVDKTVTQT